MKRESTLENIITLAVLYGLCHDVITSTRLAEFLGVTRRYANMIIKNMRERGLLEEKSLGIYELVDVNSKAIYIIVRMIEKICKIRGGKVE